MGDVVALAKCEKRIGYGQATVNDGGIEVDCVDGQDIGAENVMHLGVEVWGCLMSLCLGWASMWC